MTEAKVVWKEVDVVKDFFNPLVEAGASSSLIYEMWRCAAGMGFNEGYRNCEDKQKGEGFKSVSRAFHDVVFYLEEKTAKEKTKEEFVVIQEFSIEELLDKAIQCYHTRDVNEYKPSSCIYLSNNNYYRLEKDTYGGFLLEPDYTLDDSTFAFR